MNLKAIKIKAIATSIFFLMAFFVGSFVYAASDGLSAAQTGLEATREGAGFKNADQGGTINSMVGQIITTALSMLGVVFIVLMIYGGFVWMMARGDESQVTKAKDLITAAVIGVVIVMGAYAITYFVISKATTGTLNLSS